MDCATDGEAECDPGNASGGRQDDSFRQELPDDVTAASAERLAHSDLAGAFRYADEHDVHHTDANDHQADGGDHCYGQRDHTDDVVKVLDQRLGSVEVEIVGLVVRDLATAAKCHPGLVYRDCELPRISLDADAVIPGKRIDLTEGPVWDDYTAVAAVWSKQPAIRFFEDADDLEDVAFGRHLLADPVLHAEQSRGSVFPDHGDIQAVQGFRLREGTAKLADSVCGYRKVVSRDAAKVGSGDL